MRSIEILESMIKKARIKNWNGAGYMIQALTEAKLRIEKEESLEDVMERIGKGMLWMSFLYRNGGIWTLQAKELDKEWKGETLVEVFKKFEDGMSELLTK